LKKSSTTIRIALLALTVSTLLLQFSSSALLSDSQYIPPLHRIVLSSRDS
jgi:hypothetical protein